MAPAQAGGHNEAEYTVSELAAALKREVEGAFPRVRVRGEISQPKFYGSGHCYFRLKDANAVIEAVAWRGVVGRLAVRPEEGLEVIASGRLTVYGQRSQYQLIIESLEMAGQGALLKQLEERRKKLTAEGLFAAERKRPIPYLPAVIGVVTSPQGAVIRDILHRLADRFPRHVLVWPVAVQGERAAGEVAAAIDGFNKLTPGGKVPRPDLIIVARGGGSLEDLWAFNEEIVVRAAANSQIPLISAVGHETDTTLIDFASDKRAPTPTAAAEMAVPVRAELRAQTLDLGKRLIRASERQFSEQRLRVQAAARGLGDPTRMIEERAQRLDDRGERLGQALRGLLASASERVARAGVGLRSPRAQLDAKAAQLASEWRALAASLRGFAERTKSRIEQSHQRLADMQGRAFQALNNISDRQSARLASAGGMLESLSFRKVLERGYAVVWTADGAPIQRAAEAKPGAATIEFADGKIGARLEGGAAPSSATAKKPPRNPGSQGSLL